MICTSYSKITLNKYDENKLDDFNRSLFKVEKDYVEHSKQELPELSQTKKELEEKLKEYNK